MIRVQETPELYFPVRHTSHICLPWFAYTEKIPNDWASLGENPEKLAMFLFTEMTPISVMTVWDNAQQ